MSFAYRRAYTGRLQGVVLDWSGTTIDYGCFAPTVVFMRMFEEEGVPITMAEARGPMGTYKRDHITQITQMPAVAARWQEAHRRLPNDDDIQAMYEAFIPRQIECITQYADLIPGVKETVDAFRQRGLKVGSTTGYTHQMMEPLLPEVKKQGYGPDSLVCPDDVRGGRPAPWMCFQNAMNLDTYPMEVLVKIGDTVPDILEGLNAGMWTVGLAKTGNEIGLNEAEIAALAPEALKARLAEVYAKLYQAGAHYVVDSLADTLPILTRIEERLARGEKP
jgi:phosphonoacetaldehyde hydrolase